MKEKTTTDKPIRKRARNQASQLLVRENFTEAARHLFHTEGFKNVSMRKVAKHAGYAVGTIYLYFTNKKELLHELWVEDLKNVQQELQAIANQTIPPLAKIKSLFWVYIKYWIDRPEHYSLGFGDILEGSDSGFQGVDQQINSLSKLIVNVIQDAQDKEVLKSHIPATDIWKTVVAAAHGVLSIHYSLSIIKMPPQEYAELMLNALLEGWQNNKN